MAISATELLMRLASSGFASSVTLGGLIQIQCVLSYHVAELDDAFEVAPGLRGQAGVYHVGHLEDGVRYEARYRVVERQERRLKLLVVGRRLLAPALLHVGGLGQQQVPPE